jgi:hypothetical protein
MDEELDYLVNKNVVVVIGIKAKTIEEAEQKVAAGEGEIISRSTTFSTRERPPQPQVRSYTPPQ